jgi:diguanylate cyclase (GGDEF)-like protein/PAS domain S-box-containing protein
MQGAPLDVRDPEVLVALVDTVAILDADLRPRFIFPEHGLNAGFVDAGNTDARLGDWVHADDYQPIVDALARCRANPGVDIEVPARVNNPGDGWHLMTLAFCNRLAHPEVQGILVRAVDHTVFEREARLRALVTESPIGIYEVDASGKCTFVNPTWCRLAGVSSDEALVKGWRGCVHPDDLPGLDEQLRQSLANGTTFVGEFRFLHADGSEVWATTHSVPMHDADGELVGYLGTVEDITDRLVMAELVAANDRRTRHLLENSTDIVVVVDTEGALTYVSPAAQRVLGRRPEDHIGRLVFELLHPDDREWVEELLRLAVQNPGPFPPEELRVQHADGSWREVEITTSNLVGDPAVGGLLINVRDLTERRRAAARLHEAETRFEQVFEHATVGIHVLDLDAGFLRVNRAACLMLGYAEQYLLDTDLFAHVHPDDVQSLREDHDRLVRGEQQSYRREHRLRRSDGEWIWGRFGASLVRDDGGAPLYLVGQIEDVTEQHRLAERLAHEATHDRLTGLASRALLFEHLERALAGVRRHGAAAAVLFIDLDGFKRVNDTLGHAVGDELLVQVADRLRQSVRASDVIVRLGGDEFVICCSQLDSPGAATDLADRVLELAGRPFIVQGHEVMIGASIGIAVARGDDPVSGEQLLSNADVAAYRAKRHGRGRVEVFDETLRRELAERRRVARVVSSLLELDVLPLVLGPIVHLADGRVVGYQCTVDWDRVGISDGEAAVQIAEETGMARAFDRMMLRTVLGQLRTWEQEIPARYMPGLCFGLTVSAVLAPEFLGEVQAALTEYGVHPARVWLGVPEAAMTLDTDRATHVADVLVDRGFGVALRDFGAGVQTLEQLRRLPATTVTLAAALVDALAADDDVGTALVTSVLRFTRALGRLSLATGIPTKAEAHHLAVMGCDFGSGPAFGPLLRPEDVSAFLSSRPAG